MIKAINGRVSTRTFADEPIEGKDRETILGLLPRHTVGPFGNKIRFGLIDFDELSQREIKTLGTYGVIKGARLFLVGAVVLSDKAMEDFGYCLENIILEATNLGLGTCWIGGTFRRTRFARQIRVTEKEIVPAICPIGYPRTRRRAKERVLRLLAKSDGRKPWDELFFRGDFQVTLSRDGTGPYATALESVRIAPSASNRQPWRIVRGIEGDIYHFYLKRTMGYDRLIKEFKIQNIDMGIAMCHFELSAVETGLSGQWEDHRPDLDVPDMEYIVSWAG